MIRDNFKVLIQWKNSSIYTWEPVESIIEDLPEDFSEKFLLNLIQDFNNTL